MLIMREEKNENYCGKKVAMSKVYFYLDNEKVYRVELPRKKEEVIRRINNQLMYTNFIVLDYDDMIVNNGTVEEALIFNTNHIINIEIVE